MTKTPPPIVQPIHSPRRVVSRLVLFQVAAEVGQRQEGKHFVSLLIPQHHKTTIV